MVDHSDVAGQPVVHFTEAEIESLVLGNEAADHARASAELSQAVYRLLTDLRGLPLQVACSAILEGLGRFVSNNRI